MQDSPEFCSQTTCSRMWQDNDWQLQLECNNLCSTSSSVNIHKQTY